jgi:hypothetical protein
MRNRTHRRPFVLAVALVMGASTVLMAAAAPALAGPVTGVAASSAAKPDPGRPRAVITPAPPGEQPGSPTADPQDGDVHTDAYEVVCGSRTDWWRIWTLYHGLRCYATPGYINYGDPPNNSWTTRKICTGNNTGWVQWWYKGEYQATDMGYNRCYGFRLGDSPIDVEVLYFEIY